MTQSSLVWGYDLKTLIVSLKMILIGALVFSLIAVQAISQSYAAESGMAKAAKPSKQSSQGVVYDSLKCKDGLVLIFKEGAGSPACVTVATKNKLVQRGWVEGSAAEKTAQDSRTQSFFGSSSKHSFVPNILIIKFRNEIPESEHAAKLKGTGAQIVDSIQQIHVRILKVPDQAMDGMIQSLSKIPGVEYVEKDTEYSAEYTPNDQYFSKEWHLAKINAPAAWDINKGSATIAVADTGFLLTHQDLASKFVDGYNAYDPTLSPAYTTCSHGTFVAGVAGAIGDNFAGVVGLGMNSKIIPIKVVSDTSTTCSTSTSVLAKAITYAADHGAKAVNVSFGIGGGDNTITTAAQYLYNKGGWVVAAAGNSNAYISSSDNPYIISVGGTDQNDARWVYSSTSGSNYGPFVDFAAPAISILSTTASGGYGSSTGTSFAAPQVTALIGLMFSQDPTLTPTKVYTILKQTAVDLGDPSLDNYYGWGRIDAAKALQQISGIISLDTSSGTSSTTTSSTSGTSSTTTSSTTTTSAPPSAPVISTASTTTNNKTPTISGTAAASTTVKIYDGTILVGTVTAADGSWSAATSPLADGSHSITATATDAAGNTSSSSNVVSITVNTTSSSSTSSSSTSSSSTSSSSTFTDTTPPTVSITSPANGATVSGKITITISASDASGVAKINLYVDSKLVATLSGAPYSYNYNTKPIANVASHTITAKAYDAAGNSAVASISIKVSKK